MKIKTFHILLILSVIISVSCKKAEQDYYVRTDTVKVDKIHDYYTLEEFIKLKLDATYPGAISYLWSPTNETNPVVDYNGNFMDYSIKITTADTIVEYMITVYNSYCQLYFPSAFSPNGDRKNETWKPMGVISSDNYNLKIYNENNTIVFETTNINQGWDGKYDNTIQPYGLYYYYLVYESLSGKKMTKSGMLEMVDF